MLDLRGEVIGPAEFGRIEGGSVHILAQGDATAAQDMLIGDLTVTGPLAGSTLSDPAGILVFATGDLDTLTPGGVIRVSGDLVATGTPAGISPLKSGDTVEVTISGISRVKNPVRDVVQ